MIQIEKEPPPYPINKFDFISFIDLSHNSILGNERSSIFEFNEVF